MLDLPQPRLPFFCADKVLSFRMFDGGASQALRVVATAAATFLGGSFAVGFLSSSISERVTSFKKVKYALCVQLKELFSDTASPLV